MKKYKMSEVVSEVSERVDNPSKSRYARFVGLEHYDSGEIEITRYGSTEMLASSMKAFQRGDILIARRNVYLRRASTVDFDGITSGDSIVLRAADPIIAKLLPFVLNTDDFWDFANKYSDGTMSKRLSPKTLMQYEFILPDEDEQTRFSELLWSAYRTKQSYQKLINDTDNLVKSQFIEMFGDPNSCNNSVKLTEAFEIRDDLRKPLNDSVRSGMRTGTLYPYYGANGQVDSINEYITEYNALCMAEDCGAYGAGEASSYIISGKAWVNNHAHVLVPRSNCNIVYANEYFRLLDITKLINGSTRSKLTQDAMKKLPVVLPPRVEQDKFAMFVKQSDKSKFAALKISNRNLSRCSATRFGTIKDGITRSCQR